MKRISWIFLFAAAAIGGCGGGGGDVPAVGRIVIEVTDAPIDDAEAVLITITDFELKPVGGDSFPVPLFGAALTGGVLELDLTELTNGNTDTLVLAERLPAGESECKRIYFDESTSYIQLQSDGATYPLVIPSSDVGLSLASRFTVGVNERLTLILDFNLRSSLIEPPGQAGPNGEPRRFVLKPVVRVMNFSDTGRVHGTVDASLVDVNNDRCLAADPTLTGNAVYVFEGPDAVLDDVAAEETDGAAPPLTSDVVEFNVTEGEFEYHLGFLPHGTYTLAFTCSAMADGAGDDDYPPTPESGLDFDATINVEVVTFEDKRCAIPADADQSEPC